MRGARVPLPSGSPAFWTHPPGEARPGWCNRAEGHGAWRAGRQEIDTTGPDRCPPPPCQSPFTPSTATERKHRMKKGDAPQSEEEWWNKMIHWPEGEVCVSVCVRTHPCFSTSVWTTARRTMGQGHGKTLLWITLKQAKELGLIYERISTIYLKICNVCAAWQGKKGAATVKECLCSTLL